MNELVVDTARAVGFLSRLPVPSRCFDGADGSMVRTSRAFALAGAVIALPAAILIALVLALGLDALFASALGIAALVLLTGALHEDGLADCADGLGGGRDSQQALDIMKDSRVGTYGAIALVLSLVLRIAGLASIAHALSPIALGLIVVAAAMASRAAMVWHWNSLPPARSDGVAASVGTPTGNSVRLVLMTGGGGCLVIVWLVAGFGAVILSFAAATAIAAVFTAIVRKKPGGHTGDTIGATQQLAEIGFLFGLALWL